MVWCELCQIEHPEPKCYNPPMGKPKRLYPSPPALSPTCASATLVGLEEVKKLLVDLLPVVEAVAQWGFNGDGFLWKDGGYREPQPKPLQEKTQAILPRLQEMIKELTP